VTMTEEFVEKYRAKCPHCLGELEKRYSELGDWYYICAYCNREVPVSEIQYVPIEEYFYHAESDHMRKATLNKVEAKDKREEDK